MSRERRPETIKIAARRCPTSCQLVEVSRLSASGGNDKLAACRTFSKEKLISLSASIFDGACNDAQPASAPRSA